MEQFFEKFESVTEFIHTINTRKVMESFKDAQSSQTKDYQFTGTKDYQEANDLFLYGDKNNANKLNEALRKIKAQGKGNETRNKLYNNPCGFMPIVPKVLAGDPNNMLAIKKESYRSTKVINIIYSMSCSGGVSADEILNNSAKLVEVICQLEKNGYRINLYTGDNARFKHLGTHTAFIIKLKDSGKYLDPLKIAYPLVNPSFLRRHAFKWLETFPKFDSCGDYGCAMNGEQFREFMKDKFKNAVVLSYYDICGKDTKEIIKMIETAK